MSTTKIRSLKGFEKVPLKLWRVESEKFAIQLSVLDEKDEKMRIGETGEKRIIYIAFGGRSACTTPKDSSRENSPI